MTRDTHLTTVLTSLPRRAVAVVALATLALTACGSSEHADSTKTKTIAITISGDSVTPNGDRVDVGVDQPVELDITSDAPGQLHVHSSPPHTFEYKAGETTVTLAIDRPGVVDVESHELNKVIVQLQVQ